MYMLINDDRFKVDEAIHEARGARNAMLLYIQFIRECSARAAAVDSTFRCV